MAGRVLNVCLGQLKPADVTVCRYLGFPLAEQVHTQDCYVQALTEKLCRILGTDYWEFHS